MELTKIEKTELWITCEKSLGFGDGIIIRGFFGNLYKLRPEFHGHRGDNFIYKHPVIQYKVFGDSALIIGLKEGAYLLKAIPKLDYIEIYHKKYPIVKQKTNVDFILFGLVENMIHYSFITPWIGLNVENYSTYLSIQKRVEDINVLFEKILIGNILSMSKSIGYSVRNKLQVKAKIEEIGTIEVKNNIKLIAFGGGFKINFLIPDFWGIGKFSSRGYGTLKQINGGS